MSQVRSSIAANGSRGRQSGNGTGATAPAEPLEGRLLFAVGFTPLDDADFNGDRVNDEVVFARARRAQRILAASGATQVRRGLFVVDGVDSDAVLGAMLPLGPGAGAPLVTAGDLNGDGLADLVVANRGRRGIDVLLNDGDGGLGAPSRVGAALGRVTSLDLADFNGDGQNDLVVASADASGRARRLNPFLAFVGPDVAAGVSAEAGGSTGLPGREFAGGANPQPRWTALDGSGGTPLTWGEDFGGGAGARVGTFISAPGATAEAGGGVAPAGLPNLFLDEADRSGIVIFLGNGDGTFQDGNVIGGDNLGRGPAWTEREDDTGGGND